MSNRTGNLTNYHSHSLYCDGRANMEDFIRFALSEGFTSYGFSSHAPLPFSTAWTMEWDAMDDYLAEFHRLKAKYAGQIELYIGLEIDYLNEESNPSVVRFRELPLDYRIGSVHLLYDDKGEIVDVDVTADKFRRLVDKHFNGDLVRVVHLYYDRLMRMVELGGFDIVGHADKMHYNASAYHPGLLDEPWYDALKARIMALPLSAAGARGANSSLAVSVMISFCTCNFFRNSFFRSAILSRVMEEESGILFMMISFFIIILKEQSGNEVHHWIDDEFLAESDY